MTKYEMVMKINDLEDVKAFVKRANTIDEEVIVKSVSEKGTTYIVDGKSILGLLSLDLSHPITVLCDNKEDLKVLNPTI